MRLIVASVIFAASVCEGEEIEEKFVGGRAAVLTDTSFVVALMTCVGSTCTPFCSGSLISANVVLTAASCFRPAFSALSDDSLSPTVDSVKVLVGSKSITPIDAGGRLVSVAKIVVSSYGRNDGWHFYGTMRQMESVMFFNMLCNDIQQATKGS